MLWVIIQYYLILLLKLFQFWLLGTFSVRSCIPLSQSVFNVNHIILLSLSLYSPISDICISKVLLSMNNVGSKLMSRSRDHQDILCQTSSKYREIISLRLKKSSNARIYYYICVGRYFIQTVSCIYLDKQC